MKRRGGKEGRKNQNQNETKGSFMGNRKREVFEMRKKGNEEEGREIKKLEGSEKRR